MFKFIKSLFKKEEEIVSETVALDDLSSWLNKQLVFDDYLQDYLAKVNNFKKALLDKSKLLLQQEVSERDVKQVEARVRNIVVGHRDNYVRDVELFCRDLMISDMEFLSVDDCLQAVKFNSELNDKLLLLAKRSGKSYQATQHLFFDQVEEVFKVLAELNNTVKGFSIDIDRYAEVKSLITGYFSSRDKKFSFEKVADKKKHEKAVVDDELLLVSGKIAKILDSEEFNAYNILLEMENNALSKVKGVEQDVFSFFSKMKKPFKKYERVALEPKVISKYLEDSLVAFRDDDDLFVTNILSGLSKSLPSLAFDDKQVVNFSNLIKNVNLVALKERLKVVDDELFGVREELNLSKVTEEIKDLRSREGSVRSVVNVLQQEIDGHMNDVDKIDLDSIKVEIVLKVKELLNRELVIA